METTRESNAPDVPQRHDWGLLGGTFNPPHWGHLRLAQAALTQAKLERVLWVPAKRPPHRAGTALVPWEQRLAMVEAAIAPYPNFWISDIERTLPQKSFAIHMLTQLQCFYPDVTWHWILGMDAFASLPRWYQSDRLVERCHWLIAPRPAAPCTPPLAATTTPPVREHSDPSAVAIAQIQAQQEQWQAQGRSLQWRLLELTPLALASSEIRQRVRDRQPIDTLVPPAVAAYIQAHQLYRTATAAPDAEPHQKDE